MKVKDEDASLVVKTIMVDGARVLKRMRPAPQGRGYRVRKRSNHVTVIVDSNNCKLKKQKYEQKLQKQAAVKTQKSALKS